MVAMRGLKSRAYYIEVVTIDVVVAAAAVVVVVVVYLIGSKRDPFSHDTVDIR